MDESALMRACISTNNNYFIEDALELIEDDQANNTIHIAQDDGASSDDEKNYQDANSIEKKAAQDAEP